MKPSIRVAIFTCLLSAFILYLGVGHPNPEGYFFPIILGAVMLVLSLLLLVRAVMTEDSEHFAPLPWLRLLPALLLFIAYAFTIEVLGMYASSLLVLFLMLCIYHPNPNILERMKNSAPIALGFTASLYILFTLLLNVQMPRGFLF